MSKNRATGALDRFRIIAALMIVAIHTYPLTSVSEDADFIVVHVLFRVAVPFFLMVTGYFLSPVYTDYANSGILPLMRNIKKTLLIYAGASLVYLPVAIYAKQYSEGNAVVLFIENAVFNGTFYHLWYLPASIIGSLIVFALSRKLSIKTVFAGSLLLYLIGVFGDSYYGVIARAPALAALYGALFRVFDYTRNGVFYAPLFISLGAILAKSRRRLPQKAHAAALIAAALLMVGEGLLLRRFGLQRHDSMYILLPVCVTALFMLLLGAERRPHKRLRDVALLIYLVHPLCIIAVRGAAKFIGAERVFIDNSVLHYLAVCAASVVFAALVTAIIQKKSEYRQGRAWAELSRDSLRHNVEALLAALPENCRLMPAVKANAYGHGAVEISRELNSLGVDAFCVASVSEGVELRRGGICGEILVLGYTSREELPLLAKYGLIQTVVDSAYAVVLADYGKALRVHIKVDTGMRRLGARADQPEEIARIFSYPNLTVTGIFTHLCADDTELQRDVEYTAMQLAAFDAVLIYLEQAGISLPKTHIQGSYGIVNCPRLVCDYARAGIALYGMLSTGADTENCAVKLEPVLTLKARVSVTRALKQGESVGYGIDFTARSDMRIATLTVGYADGIPRELSNGRGAVLLRGKKAPVIGRICMDQLMIDVTEIPDAAPGDAAVLIGRDGALAITANDWAGTCNTISNEILTGIGPRVQRIVV